MKTTSKTKKTPKPKFTSKRTNWNQTKKGDVFIVINNTNNHNYDLNTPYTVNKNPGNSQIESNIAVEGPAKNNLHIKDVQFIQKKDIKNLPKIITRTLLVNITSSKHTVKALQVNAAPAFSINTYTANCGLVHIVNSSAFLQSARGMPTLDFVSLLKAHGASAGQLTFDFRKGTDSDWNKTLETLKTLGTIKGLIEYPGNHGSYSMMFGILKLH